MIKSNSDLSRKTFKRENDFYYRTQTFDYPKCRCYNRPDRKRDRGNGDTQRTYGAKRGVLQTLQPLCRCFFGQTAIIFQNKRQLQRKRIRNGCAFPMFGFIYCILSDKSFPNVGIFRECAIVPLLYSFTGETFAPFVCKTVRSRGSSVSASAELPTGLTQKVFRKIIDI